MLRYADTMGGYLVVEDTNINGHPVVPGWGAGPFEAVAAFLESDNHFIRDDEVWQRIFFRSISMAGSSAFVVPPGKRPELARIAESVAAQIKRANLFQQNEFAHGNKSIIRM